MPVERRPDSILIRDRNRVTAIARRTASLASLRDLDLLTSSR
jgi:hypothetical protein